MRRRLLTITMVAALVCGCVEGGIPVRVSQYHDPDEVEELFAEASEILTIPIQRTDEDYGILTLGLVRTGLDVAGETLVYTGCLRSGWAEASPPEVAHEVAHMLQLHVNEHHPDPENLMHKNIGIELEDWQVDTLEEELMDFRLLCPNSNI
jgi:hypothetical protein